VRAGASVLALRSRFGWECRSRVQQRDDLIQVALRSDDEGHDEPLRTNALGEVCKLRLVKRASGIGGGLHQTVQAKDAELGSRLFPA
jgi:hypothetical protein